MDDPIHLQRFFELSPDMMLALTKTGHILKSNRACEVILGYTPEELQDRAVWELIHPDDREWTGREANRISTGERTAANGPIENRYICKDGSYRWISWHAQRAVEGVSIAIGRDVTRRVEASQQSDARQASLLALARLIADGSAPTPDRLRQLLRDGNEFLGTDSALLAQRYPATVGSPFTVLEAVGPEGTTPSGGDPLPAALGEFCLAAMQQGEIIERDGSDPSAAGDPTVRAVLCDGIYVRSEPFGILCFYGTRPRTVSFHDADRSWIRVASRWVGETMLLAQTTAELVETRDRALALARARSERLANFSHELRTPMNVIVGTAELLHNESTDTAHRKMIRSIRKSADSLLDVIGHVLDQATLDAGQLTLERTPFELRAMLESTVGLLLPTARDKALSLAIAVPPVSVDAIVGDPFRIRQVLTNLLSNAIKFTEAGDVVVEAEVQPTREDRGDLILRVRDTGVGIPPADIDAIFDAYRQVSRGDTRRFGGIGLGLAISRQLVQLMDGTIHVESEPGRGSIFQVRIPVGLQDVPSRHGELADAFAGSHALLIGLSPTDLMVIEPMLHHWGMQTAHVPSGRDAFLAIEASEPPDRLAINEPREPIPAEPTDPRAAGLDRPYDLILLGHQLDDLDPMAFLARLSFLVPSTLARTLLLQPERPSRDEAGRRTDIAVGGILHRPIRQNRLYERIARVLLRQGSVRADDDYSDDVSGEHSDDRNTLPAVAPTPAEAMLHAREPRVLIVEDFRPNRKLLEMQLRNLGVESHYAENGEAAIERYRAGEHVLILMDIQMPTLDGIEATRAIRTRERVEGTPRVPIVAMTANHTPDDRERCLAAGMDDIISKPIHLAQLREILRAWYPSGRPESDTAPSRESPDKPRS